MRRSWLMAGARALGSSRLLAIGLAAVLLGIELGVLSSPLLLSALGVLLAAAGVAVLIATAGYRRVTDDAGRRLALAALLFVSITPLAVLLWLQHPAVDVALEKIAPTPGAPLVLSGISSPNAGELAPGESPPLLEGTFGAFEIADVAPPLPTERGAPAGSFQIRLPVAASDCGRLKVKFGGGCGDEPSPRPSGFQSFEIRTLRREQPLSAEIRPRNARTLELTKTTALEQQRVPTEWNLVQDSPRAEVDFQCVDGAPLRVKTLFARARVHCALGGAIFQVSVKPEGRFPATLFLSELGEFDVHTASHTAKTTVNGAEMTIGGDEQGLVGRPVEISMQAAERHFIDFKLSQSIAADLNDVSLSSSSVSTLATGGREQVPNWFAQNSETAYFILGILIATLVPALFDFALARLNR